MKKDPIERIARDAEMLKKLHLLGIEMKAVEMSGENNTKRIDLITSLGGLISSLNKIASDLSGVPYVKIKRFRIIDYDRNVLFKFDRLEEISASLFNMSYTQCKSINSYQIECVVDDIIVSATEVLQAYEDGECPVDLQFF